MPNKVVILTDLSVSMLASQLTNEQIISLLIFGSTKNIGLYDPTKTYNKNDKTIFFDGTSYKAYSAKTNGVTGTFDLTKWTEFSLLGGNIGGGSAMGDTVLTTALNNNVIDLVMHM